MDGPAPTCFLSYAWETPQHREWVFRLAEDLIENGVAVRIDRELRPGASLTAFMETAIRESDFVVIVCTPTFAAKANSRAGGVGYETGVVTGEIFESAAPTKFVPILRSGTTRRSVPSYLKGRLALDFRTDRLYETELTHLVRHIWNEPAYRPTGPNKRPPFSDSFEARRRPQKPTRPEPVPTVSADNASLPTAPVPDLTGEEISRLIDTDPRPVVVEFWAPWCGPCRMSGPIIEDIAAEYSESARFVRANVDEQRVITAQHEVMAIPTTIIFKEGKPREKITGAFRRSHLVEQLAPHLEKAPERIDVQEETLTLTLQDGRIRVAILRTDGTYSYVTEDANRLGLVYLPDTSRLTSAIDEFEALLNDSYTTKADIRGFLEEHHELMLGGEYRSAHSRIFLRRDGRQALRPDFMLEPIAGELADVYEVQPAHQQVADEIDGTARLSEVVVEACARLHEYRDYFEDERRRIQVEDEHGIKVFRPRMFIVIGRANQIDALTRRRLETQLNDVKLQSWDDVLTVARARLERARY